MASWFDQANTGIQGDAPNSMLGSVMALPWSNMLGGLSSLYGGIQGMGTANQVNANVQSGLNQNQSATQRQIDELNAQIQLNRQQAQDAYNRSLGDVTSQNQGLQGNIDTMTGNLTALNDPNSPYMQMARQAIERKDAAAGRRSQWGEREVQLAGTLADYVGKYAPGLQNSITAARNQINQNNQGLASLYSNMNNPADRNTMSLLSALQQQLRNSEAINTTGRQAANSAINNRTGLLNQGINLGGQLIGGLSGLFGGNQNSVGITDLWSRNNNMGLGTGGWAGLGSNLYGSETGGWGFGDQGLGTGMGFTGGGLGGGFLDLGGTGSLGSGLDFQAGGLGQGLQGFGTAFGGYGATDWGDYGDY